MLYTTTRSNADTFTVHRVLHSQRAPDGGQFLPFHLPVFSQDDLIQQYKGSFNDRVARAINILFSKQLTGYDIDLALGKRSVRMQQLNQRLFTAECWHNPQWDYSGMEKQLLYLICDEKDSEPAISDWAEIGIRMAVLFGIVGEMVVNGLASQEKPVDLAMLSGNFSAPMAAWYARGMGLPIGNIVCCCNENSALWDFICHGQLRTDGIARRTMIPEADIMIPKHLEHLISLYGGPAEVAYYVDCLHIGKTYYAEDGLIRRLRQGIYVTVSSENRILNTVSNSFSTHKYLLSLSSSLSYAGLQDYRARTGESRTAVILTEKSPRLDMEAISGLTGISDRELEQYL